MAEFLRFFRLDALNTDPLAGYENPDPAKALIDRNAVLHFCDLYFPRSNQDPPLLKLRIPYLLAATLFAASLFYLSDTPGLSAAPLVSMTTSSGQKVNLAAPEGKARLIAFWSPDCPISERNIPAMSDLQAQFGGAEFEVLAIAMPYSEDSEIESFLKKGDINISVAHDKNGVVSDAFPGVRFTPTTFLIDGSGDIVWRHVGRMTATQGAARIVEVLQTQPPAS